MRFLVEYHPGCAIDSGIVRLVHEPRSFNVHSVFSLDCFCEASFSSMVSRIIQKHSKGWYTQGLVHIYLRGCCLPGSHPLCTRSGRIVANSRRSTFRSLFSTVHGSDLCSPVYCGQVETRAVLSNNSFFTSETDPQDTRQG